MIHFVMVLSRRGWSKQAHNLLETTKTEGGACLGLLYIDLNKFKQVIRYPWTQVWEISNCNSG